MKTSYDKGDDVWIHLSEASGKLTKGKVLEVLDLSEHGYTFSNYLIAIPTGIEPLLEVRNAMTMSEDKKGPVGLFRKMKESMKNAG